VQEVDLGHKPVLDVARSEAAGGRAAAVVTEGVGARSAGRVRVDAGRRVRVGRDGRQVDPLRFPEVRQEGTHSVVADARDEPARHSHPRRHHGDVRGVATEAGLEHHVSPGLDSDLEQALAERREDGLGPAAAGTPREERALQGPPLPPVVRAHDPFRFQSID
jgi:hypothetical protein